MTESEFETESERLISVDFDTSDWDFMDENSPDMSAKLVAWANEFKIPHVALQKLLFLLYPSFPNLPKDTEHFCIHLGIMTFRVWNCETSSF